MRNHTRTGFTLIELMIVVAIIGILAGIAIPSVSAFIKASKKAEGSEKLKALADGAITYFNAEHIYSSSGLNKTAYLYPGCQGENVAASACDKEVTCESPQLGTKTLIADTVWNSQPWMRLGFHIGGPTYFCFEYSSSVDINNSSFSARAFASLSDEEDSEFTITGDADGKLTPLIEKK